MLEVTTDKPLNQLNVSEYLEDYKLYLTADDMPADQRNLTTYFAEFEHQEGEIATWKKRTVAHRMAAEYRKPFHEAMGEIETKVHAFILSVTRNECDTYKGDKPVPRSWSHEEIQVWVEKFVDSMMRGVEKGGF